MKAKVIRSFTDKYTGELYRKGDMLDITEERYAEIMSVGQLLWPIEHDNADSDPEKPDDGFEGMTVSQLKEYADQTYKLTFGNGTKKAEIIEELRKMERGNK